MIRLQVPQNQSPFFYAAAEEWLVRNADFDEDVLLLYINEPCVVIGKNQCVWKEVNWDYIWNENSKVVRRVSGGGTVYHDGGNLCFAFISKFAEHKVNNYRYFNQCIVDALKKLGVDAEFSERNDIFYQGKKISGNAQFTNRKNILSHGTLLFDANLDLLRLALKANDFEVKTKAVSSVRSPVMNLNEVVHLSFEVFCTELVAHLPITSHVPLEAESMNAIRHLQQEKYETPAWTLGQSPRAEIVKEEISFEIEEGLLQSIQSSEHQKEFELLNGSFFSPDAIEQRLSTAGFAEDIKQNMKQRLFY